MTSMIIEDTRQRVVRAQRVLGVMLGATCAGFYPGLAFYALVVNAIVWGGWFASTTKTARDLRRLEMKAVMLERDAEEHISH